ncbi:hypothetical protein [Rhodococcus sp. BS-15]|uniref:hypothetical protein n=1 Tax=Rhodococcus sp. BS-15 TaxID=1304954 RepID=UPI000FFB2979|nr:hypothetical protein [Rhodococcus sp. BS-15]
MSNDGTKAAARRGAWRKIHSTCECGVEVYGNGKNHFRSCSAHLESAGWPMDSAMRDALRHEGHMSADIVRIERALGQIYLDRRAHGDKSEMPWSEYRDTVWQLADA